MQNKKIALMAMALTALPALAQQYEICGTAPAGARVVYLQNLESRTPDSVEVSNGKFCFKGDAQGKVFGMLASNVTPGTYVILDGKVNADMQQGVVSGTPENDGLELWSQKMQAARTRMQQLNAEYASYKEQGKEMPAEVEKRIVSDYEAEMAKINAIVVECCEQNTQMKFPALFLGMNANSMNKADIIRVAENGNPAFMNTGIMSRIKQNIEGWKRQMPGKRFTDLEMNDTTGKPHKLSEYVGKGKYVLIDFWASWCGPCRKEMPNVKALYEKYKDKGFDIVGLSFDNDAKAWQGAIRKMGINWNHLSDLKGWQSVAVSTYGISSIPAMLLVDPEGKIVAGGLSVPEIDRILGEALK